MVMDGFALDGAWLVSLVVAGVTGWIAGRWGRLWAKGAIARPFAQGPAPGHRPTPRAGSVATGHLVPKSRELVRALEEMPPVERVREQAEAIRREANLWQSPGLAHHVRRLALAQEGDPAGVLAHYRAAIESLDLLDQPVNFARIAGRDAMAHPVAAGSEGQPSSSTRV